jgi:hypothetical protein
MNDDNINPRSDGQAISELDVAWRDPHRKTQSIASVVREIIELDGAGSRSAVERLIQMAADDPEIYKTLIKYGAEQAVRDYYHAQRKTFARAPSPAKQSNPVQDVERAEQKRKRRLFWDRYALFGHMQLKTATRQHLCSSVESRRLQAAGNLRCAAFEEDIMGRMKDESITVGKQFKSAEVVEIAEKYDVI